MLAVFLETFVWVFAIFFLFEITLKLLGVGNKLQEQELEQAINEFEDAIMLCKVEQIDDVYYLYNSQNDNFVGQARTAQEFIDLSEGMQKHIMIVDGEDKAVDSLKVLIDEIRS